MAFVHQPKTAQKPHIFIMDSGIQRHHTK